ncbi:MAG: MFS transporter, partial [Burkholderiales bacterium]
HTQGGLLSGFWYLPGMLVALPSGWLFDRYRIQRILLLCWVFIVLGIAVMAVAPSFWVLCAGRLIFSTGMNAHMVGAPKLVSTWFEGRKEAGLVMGLYTMSFPIGVFSSLNVLGRIGDNYGWRPAMYVMAGITVVGFLLVFLIPSVSPRLAAETDAARVRFQPLQLGWAVWVLSLGYFGYSIGTEAYLTFTPDYLVHRGYALAAASATVGSYAWASFFLKPVFSSFLKRNNAPVFVLAASVLAILSIVLLLSASASGVSPVIPSIILGVSLALGMPSLYALPAFLVGHEKSGQVYGLYQLFYSFGFFAQPLVGYAIDRAGGYTSGYLVMIAYCVLGLLCILPFIRQRSEWRRSEGQLPAAEKETSLAESK